MMIELSLLYLCNTNEITGSNVTNAEWKTEPIIINTEHIVCVEPIVFSDPNNPANTIITLDVNLGVSSRLEVLEKFEDIRKKIMKEDTYVK